MFIKVQVGNSVIELDYDDEEVFNLSDERQGKLLLSLVDRIAEICVLNETGDSAGRMIN